jgi:hypothetical protein
VYEELVVSVARREKNKKDISMFFEESAIAYTTALLG